MVPRAPSRRMITRITDADDPRLAPYHELRERPHARDPTHFVAESEIAVARLLQSRFAVQSVVATPSHAARIAPLAAAGVPVLELERPLLNAVVGFDFHRGCAACGSRPADFAPLAEEVLAALQSRPRSTVVVAVGLADPANVGALVRTCRAFAVDLLVVDDHGADPFSRRSIRASMGHVFTQPLAVLGEVSRWIARTRRELGMTTVATTVGPEVASVDDLPDVARLLLLVGNEGHGLPADLLDAADEAVTVPIDPGADSLNVGAAVAVLLHVLRPFRRGR